MKRLPVLAAVAATAVAGAAVLTGTATADAATTAGVSPRLLDASTQSLTWITSADLQTYSGTGEPPTGTWYTGTATGFTTPTFGPSGLTFSGPGVLLHSTDGHPASDLTSITSSTDTDLGTADLVSSDDADFTLVVDLDGDGEIADQNYAALVAVTGGDEGIDGEYTSFTPVGTIPAGTPATLAQFQAQFAATSPDATIREYGVSDATGPATVTGIAFDGQNDYFTPRPSDAGTITPATLSVSDFATTGVAVSQPNGFLPGEPVSVALVAEDGTATDTGVTLTAGADGSVVGTVTDPDATAGTYALTLFGENSGIFVGFVLDVTADPAVTTPTTPPAPVATPVTTTATFTG
ncbi:hypothetical protein [Curtobacterium sp. MCBD17_003]|uniref:hypothetical protein n=1 Tax=Curtobacterium sp. MCBD17_003 TaxID=2175667 RepID=UPI000DA9CCAE|nr:hypothetical protein [Curtobacterium sp. MCBD17_003]WIE54656.1 hypothetical protein DEI88_000175 [Curtobacterium sp. MCBD17_003]